MAEITGAPPPQKPTWNVKRHVLASETFKPDPALAAPDALTRMSRAVAAIVGANISVQEFCFRKKKKNKNRNDVVISIACLIYKTRVLCIDIHRHLRASHKGGERIIPPEVRK